MEEVTSGVTSGSTSETVVKHFSSPGLEVEYWRLISASFGFATTYDDAGILMWCAVHKDHHLGGGGYFPDAVKGIGYTKGEAVADWISRSVRPSMWKDDDAEQ